MSNTVNDLGDDRNFFDERGDTDAEICQLASSPSPLDDDECARMPPPRDVTVPTGDLAALAEVSVDVQQLVPLPAPVRCLDPDRQWLRDALASIADAPAASNQIMSADVSLAQLPANGEDPLQIDSLPPDVNAELDLLLNSLQLATPQPGSASIEDIRLQISTVEPVTHTQQLLQELNDAREQLVAAQTILQLLNRRNQAQVDRVDINIQEVKQIKFHTQQLALYSKSQVEIGRELLDACDRIRMEIVATLDLVGGYERLQGLGVQLETAQNLLTVSDKVTETIRERIAAERAAFDASVRSLQREVAAHHDDSAAKLRQYQQSVENLVQTIATDRLQTVEINTKLREVSDLGDRLTTMHERVVEKSQPLQSKISQIERSFVELSQSIQSEKQQFYALTVATIEKADLLRSQLTQIANQIEDNRATISQLQADITAIHQSTPAQIDRQLDSTLNVRDRQLLAIYHDLQDRHYKGVATVKKLSNWLWILSVVVGTMSIVSIWMVISFKRAAFF